MWTSNREIAKWGVVSYHGELSLTGPDTLLEAILLGDSSKEGWAADGRRSCSHGCHPISSYEIRRWRSRVDHDGLTRGRAEECEFLGEAQANSEAKSGDGAGLGNPVGQWLLTRACGQRADKASTRLLPRGRTIEIVPPNTNFAYFVVTQHNKRWVRGSGMPIWTHWCKKNLIIYWGEG